MEDIKLWHGDCLELMQDIKAGSIDAVICDPPYGTTSCKWDSVIDFGLMWEQLNRVIKPNGAIVLFGSEPFSSALRMSNIKNYKYDIVWDKVAPSSGVLAKKRPLNAHELISIFYKKQPTYNPQMQKGRQWRRGGKARKSAKVYGQVKEIRERSNDKSELKYPKQIFICSNADKTKRLHPTQKPVPLMEYLIKTYTNEGETVLDFTMGSGTTMVACQNTKRKGIGIEQLDKYFNIAQERTAANRQRLSQLLF